LDAPLPRISIITATRSRPRELEEALRSSIAQDFADFEHLVVDDASPENSTEQVLDALADPRLRLIRLEQSVGPAGARNAALREAKGEYVAILDDDDVMAPGRLAKTAAYLDSHPDHLLVGGWFEAIDAAGTLHAVVRPPTGEDRIRGVLPFHNPFLHSSCLIRTSTMKALGGFREPLRYAHDYDLILRLAEAGRIEILPEVLARYRFHTENITTRRGLLQGAYAGVARECARRRAAGEPELLEEQVAAIAVPDDGGSQRRAEARVHYQIGEWMFRDGRVREARPWLRRAWAGEPLRPLCSALLIASYTPAFLRRLVGPPFRRLAASRYASWR
jgi:glycosyltransferase involved in cell wall biosynthesis